MGDKIQIPNLIKIPNLDLTYNATPSFPIALQADTSPINPLGGMKSPGLLDKAKNLVKGAGSGSGSGVNAAAGALGSMVGSMIGGGLTSGVGNVIGQLGGIAQMIPGVGGVIASAAAPILQGGINALVGSSLNQENINTVNANNAALNSFSSNASSTEALAQNFKTMPAVTNFNKSFIGKDGVFANKASKMFKQLQKEQTYAVNNAQNALNTNLNNMIGTQYDNMMANYAAEGGFLAQPYIGGAIDYELAQRRMAQKDLEARHLADGGSLHSYGSDWTNGLSIINSGDTHERNPLGGVPMGMAEDGQPNLVEEGEVVWNDYVFSNRLKVPSELAQRLKLKNKDNTFAEAVKHLQKNSEERPNDPIEQAGLKNSLIKLMNAQEILRQKSEERKMRRQAKKAALGGLLYNCGGHLFAPGGVLNPTDPDGNPLLATSQPTIATPSVLDLPILKGYVPKDITNPANNFKEVSFWGEPLTNRRLSLKDWYNQTVKDPKNYANILNYLDANDSKSANLKKTYAKNAKGFLNYALTGQKGRAYDAIQKAYNAAYAPQEKARMQGIKPPEFPLEYFEGEVQAQDAAPVSAPLTKEQWKEYTRLKSLDKTTKTDVFAKKYLHEVTGTPLETLYKGQEIPAAARDTIQPEHYNLARELRWMPAIGSGLAAFSDAMGWTNTPDESGYRAMLQASQGMTDPAFSPIPERLRLQRFSTREARNDLNAQEGAVERGIANQSNLNRGNAISGLIAAGANAQKNYGNAYKQGLDSYNAQTSTEGQFNRGTSMFNSEKDLQAQMARNSNLQFKANLLDKALTLRDLALNRASAARSANLTNLYDSLGDIGREAYAMDMIHNNKALLYDWFGRYKGSMLDYANGETVKDSKTTKAAKGGFLTIKNKRRRR